MMGLIRKLTSTISLHMSTLAFSKQITYSTHTWRLEVPLYRLKNYSLFLRSEIYIIYSVAYRQLFEVKLFNFPTNPIFLQLISSSWLNKLFPLFIFVTDSIIFSSIIYNYPPKGRWI